MNTFAERDNEEKKIKCIDGEKIYWVPRATFARVVLDVKVPGRKYVRYKTGAQIYDMSERQFKELAKRAGATCKINQMVLVNMEKFDEFIECFNEEMLGY